MATNNAVNTNLSGQTGTGSFAGSTSPTFVTPILGTPASGNLANCTAYSTANLTGLGSGVATALAVNTNSTGGFAVETDGTFTPILNIGGGTTGITYSLQTGNQSRVGNVVTFSIQMALTSKGALTGNLTITGLSSSPRNPLNNFDIMINSMTLTGSPAVYLSSGTTLTIAQMTTGTLATCTDTNLSNTSEIFITGSYLI